MALTLKIILILGVLSHKGVAEERTDNKAVIVRSIGKVQVLRPTTKYKTSKGENPKRLLYRAKIYHQLKSYEGMLVADGDVIQTKANGRARIVYDNGDQFSIGTETSFHLEERKDDNIFRISLIFGKMRGLIKKESSRSGMEIKTPSMAMGVRGTDFHILANGLSGGSELSVLSGEVEVKARKQDSPSVTVRSGQTLKIKLLAENVAPAFNINATKSEDLIYIQKSSIFPRPKTMMALTAPKRPTRVVNAESNAVSAFLQDHRSSHPRFYDRYKQQIGNMSLDDIQEAFIQFLIKKAETP